MKTMTIVQYCIAALGLFAVLAICAVALLERKFGQVVSGNTREATHGSPNEHYAPEEDVAGIVPEQEVLTAQIIPLRDPASKEVSMVICREIDRQRELDDSLPDVAEFSVVVSESTPQQEQHVSMADVPSSTLSDDRIEQMMVA